MPCPRRILIFTFATDAVGAKLWASGVKLGIRGWRGLRLAGRIEDGVNLATRRATVHFQANGMIDASSGAFQLQMGVAAQAPRTPNVTPTSQWGWLDYVPLAGTAYHGDQFGACVFGAVFG